MEIKFECEDGFMAKGNEDEITEVAALHMIRNHPEMRVNKEDLKKHMEEV